MNAIHTKSRTLFERIRKALQEGRYLPGQHIEPSALAREYKISITPVRFALYRLMGAGMVENHARGGLFVPLPDEVTLRDRYDWMRLLLTTALDVMRSRPPATPASDLPPPDPQDVPKATWKLFDAIAQASEQSALNQAVRHTNDQLAPVRRGKQTLLADAPAEIARLHALWASQDLASLQAGIDDYHQRRQDLVPRIVAHLNARRARME